MIGLHNNSIFVVSLFALLLISGFIADQTAYAYDGDTSKFSVLKEELAREKKSGKTPTGLAECFRMYYASKNCCS